MRPKLVRCSEANFVLIFIVTAESFTNAAGWERSLCVAGALHDRPTRGGFTAHQQRDSDEAFVADHRNFRGAPLA
jgi:hypothetical protein